MTVGYLEVRSDRQIKCFVRNLTHILSACCLSVLLFDELDLMVVRPCRFKCRALYTLGWMRILRLQKRGYFILSSLLLYK